MQQQLLLTLSWICLLVQMKIHFPEYLKGADSSGSLRPETYHRMPEWHSSHESLRVLGVTDASSSPPELFKESLKIHLLLCL